LPINSQINGPTISRAPAIRQVAFTGRVRIFNENGEQVSPADLQQLAAEENESDDA
jgi:hypothetical protein